MGVADEPGVYRAHVGRIRSNGTVLLNVQMQPRVWWTDIECKLRGVACSHWPTAGERAARYLRQLVTDHSLGPLVISEGAVVLEPTVLVRYVESRSRTAWTVDLFGDDDVDLGVLLAAGLAESPR